MTDNLKTKRSSDGERVSLMEKNDVKYWTEKLGTTEIELQNAMDATGPMLDNVNIWLRTHGKIKKPTPQVT